MEWGQGEGQIWKRGNQGFAFGYGRFEMPVRCLSGIVKDEDTGAPRGGWSLSYKMGVSAD